jgi:hypothetical protein
LVCETDFAREEEEAELFFLEIAPESAVETAAGAEATTLYEP